ncbi:Aste57867_22456 [Aphanomyces stellatus]|uniref:Aste57867_22456 protein n=1 Tax=Aphanomyces stellatus TaxID=120398 RepID=A0A485LKB3_9STRA|nr:hypothetical protein As57867_022386 [Aphanomyces stellatus]VFT99116.1 Aste57867_22456 [Aphanomyces stellatus]
MKMMTSPLHPPPKPTVRMIPKSSAERACRHLSSKIKRARQDDTSCGLLSYTAKKRRSIEKYIEGASEADSKASSDMGTLILYLDESAAKREESRMERQEKADREREAREARREEMHHLLIGKLFGQKEE